MIRASGLASSTGLSSGGTESGGFWEGKARSALQALLHAAALEQLPTRALFEWSLSASAATDAVGILASHPHAAAGWSDSLEGMISSDPRTRDSIWMAVAQALSCLADPAVLDAVSPEPGEEFDPRDFLTQNGTLYLLATGAGAGASWPLVAAFMEDLTEVARHLAAASPGSRLDPPVLMALDEIGNLAPLPSLPVLMAEGGGTGITPCPSSSRSPRRATSGATTPPAPSGTPRSSRSSSAAPPPRRTSRNCPSSSANATSAPTPSPSATTASVRSSARPAGSRSCRRSASGRCRSAPAWCSSEALLRSSRISDRGPVADCAFAGVAGYRVAPFGYVRAMAKYPRVREQHIAVFGESGSGKTVLVSSFYGPTQEGSYKNDLWDLVADETGQGNRLYQNYLGMRDRATAPLPTRFASTTYYFSVKLKGGDDAEAKKRPFDVLRLAWHDYPGEWFEESPSSEEEAIRRVDTFRSLLRSDVALLLVDGQKLLDYEGEEERYLKSLLTTSAKACCDSRTTCWRGGPLVEFPRIWIIALSKADLFPDWDVHSFRDLVIRKAADHIDDCARRSRTSWTRPKRCHWARTSCCSPRPSSSSAGGREPVEIDVTQTGRP